MSDPIVQKLQEYTTYEINPSPSPLSHVEVVMADATQCKLQLRRE
jgi:hypothetical protein